MKAAWTIALAGGAATALFISLPTRVPAATPQASGSPKKSPAQALETKTAPASPEWQALLKGAAAAGLAGNTGDAEDKYRLALESSEKSHDDKGLLTCLTALANCLSQATGKLSDEGALRQRALTLAEKTYGQSSARYAASLACLAGWNARNGEVEKARENADKSMQILGNASDKFPLEMADCCEAVALRQIAQGTFGLADDSFKQALELRQSKLPDSDPLVYNCCRQYADLLKQLGRKDEASKLLQRITLARATMSTSPASKSTGNTGKPSANKLSIFSKLIADAQVADKAGDAETAINSAKLAVADAEKSGGKDGKLPYALVKLADIYSHRNRREEAQALYKKALDLREESAANKTLGMVRNLERVSTYAMQNKNTSESKRLLSQALEIEDQLSAPDSMISDTLQQLLSACLISKDFSKAEQVASRLSKVADKISGPLAELKKRMATSMLGSIYMQTGRQSEGLALLKSLGRAQASPDISQTYKQEYETKEKLIDDSEEAGFVH